jgi:N-acetylmuramoyl-L-alanine amidase
MSSVGTATLHATGERILELARRHVGEKYILGVLVPKDNPNWTGPWNCSEFVSWTVFQASAFLYGCDRDFGDPSTAHAFTGFWERDAKSLGQIISIEQAASIPGAVVLRFPQVGATGHVVICDGNGGTVEAHSSVDGVIHSTLNNRRWDVGVLVTRIQYTRTADVVVSPPKTLIYRMTAPIMQGDKVLAIQQALKQAGFDPGTLDGEFGPHTLSAVVAFQISHQLLPDGEVGAETSAALGVSL